tara:strand:- start:195 stop:539 length:345 start_codon:yes stop_codon:yes gene_type:complete
MSDNWISAKDFNKKVEEIEADLNKRWDDVYHCQLVQGFFQCSNEEDHTGYASYIKVRVCDGCGDELHPTDSVCADFCCYECEMWYSGISGDTLRPPSEWGYDTGESFDDGGRPL